ncbi:hypothetical protein TrRE_jg12911, partial [Triparma retinervis]
MKKCLLPAIKLMLHDLIPERGTVPCCPISGIPFTFVKGGDNPVSINRKNNTIKDHTLDNIEIIASRFNVQQHQAIPNIKGAFKDIFRDMRLTFDPNFEADLKTEAGKRTAAAERNLKRTPKKNGVTADQRTDRSGYDKEKKEKDLTTVISQQVSKHIDTDAKINKWTAGQQKTFRKRYGKEIKKELAKKLLEQQLTCFYSKLPIGLRNNHSRLSMERLDNRRSHFRLIDNGCGGIELDVSNVVWIMRILQGNKGGGHDFDRGILLKDFINSPLSFGRTDAECAVATRELENLRSGAPSDASTQSPENKTMRKGEVLDSVSVDEDEDEQLDGTGLMEVGEKDVKLQSFPVTT